MSTAPRADGHGSSSGTWEGEQIDLRELLKPLRENARLLAFATVAAGAIGYGASYLVTPQFTSTTTFLPPQQQQSAAASALSSLGMLAGLAGGAVKSPAEEYVSLMQSVTVSDRMIDRFHLMQVYKKKYRVKAREALQAHTQILVGKKDGIISVAVTDEDPRRAADMANQYVEELRRMTTVLAVSEAQQRRVFFEKQMKESQSRLVTAQADLQRSGFTAGAIKAEPQAAAEQYAQLRAQATTAEVRLQTLRASLAETSPEVRQQAAQLQALKTQLAQLEASSRPDSSAPDYIGKYREFKYQEALFDMMAKQYELARVDESREGALVQVVDGAEPAELKSSPRRSMFAGVAALMALLATSLSLIRRRFRSDVGR